MPSLKEFIRDLTGKPAELAELKRALNAAPEVPTRPEMDGEEFARLAREQKARIADFRKASERLGVELAAEREKAAAVKQKADEAVRRLEARLDSERNAFVHERDAVGKQLLDGRPAVLSERAEQLRKEAASLTVDRYSLPEGTVPHSAGAKMGELVDERRELDAAIANWPRDITNSASVNSRRAGLFALAEGLTDWAWSGAFATLDEFEARFAQAYAALPKVTPLRDVMATDIRGRHFVKLLPRAASIPPAA